MVTRVGAPKKDNTKEMIDRKEAEVLRRGFLFACTSGTEAECLDRMLLAPEKSYGPICSRLEV